jgi:hypothetical protein
LLEELAVSRLYAMDSDPPAPDSLRGDPAWRYLARREARPLAGDAFLRAVRSALGVNAAPQESAGTPLARQLSLLNSGLLQQWLRAPGNQVDALFDFQSDPAVQLEQLYLLLLSRPPGPAERAEFLPLLQQADDPRAAGRDLAFALLASREFGSIR